MPSCEWYFCHAIQYTCTLAIGLDEAQTRRFMDDAVFQPATAAFAAALRTEDRHVARTACQAWMRAARQARHTVERTEGVPS